MATAIDLPVTPDSTEEDKLAFGRWVNERYRPGWQVELDDGTTRDVTQFELYCGGMAAREDAWSKREQDGCCEQMLDDGSCLGCGGWCPRVDEAATAVKFCEQFLKWVAEMSG